MLADNMQDLHDPALAGDDIENELAFLTSLLEQAGDAEVAATDLATIELLREEGAITAPRPRFERRGPVLTQVAAVGLATFPAAIAPLPAMAQTPLPPSLEIAMAARPAAPPVHHVSTSTEVLPFSHSMQDVRARVQTPGFPARPLLAQAHAPHHFTPDLPVTAASEAPDAEPTEAKASALPLNPRLKTMFTNQRKVAVTTKRQMGTTFYQVSHGDSLYSIAADLLGSGSRWREIYDANHHKVGAGYLLKPGSRLLIPANHTMPDVHLAHFKGQPGNSPQLASAGSVKSGNYMVARGDNLYTIAAKRLHNANRWREIVALNKARLGGKTVIYPNQWLLLPNSVT